MDPGTAIDGTGTLAEHLRVTDKGKVGIGTTNPSEKLHIGNGNIYIESDTATGGTGVGLIMFGEGTGADPSLYMGYDGDGMTPLMRSIGYSGSAIVKLLLDKGANVHIKSRSGKTALDIARERNNKEVIQLLLKAGAKK